MKVCLTAGRGVLVLRKNFTIKSKLAAPDSMREKPPNV